jgi:uncharacterized protein
MQFVNREEELSRLQSVRNQSHSRSCMTVVTGRRRIGKTRLIRESLRGETYLYFFVSRKEEGLLCEEFVEQIQRVLRISIFGTIRRFKEVFALLLEESKNQPINLVIDEFQEFYRVNPSVFSDVQHLWDLHKEEAKMNLILSGSVFSMMTKLFEDHKEPLFGRATERLHIGPFRVNDLREILAKRNSRYTADDLLTFYMITGGVPKYVELLVDQDVLSHTEMIDNVFRPNSVFLDEGKLMLVEEFGKEYTTYFSILSLLAASKTSRGQIESIIQKNIGGYLDRLEKDYRIIRKLQPILAKPGSRRIKYEIEDNFLHFWFRFLYKNKAAVEIENFAYIKKLFHRDYETYSGYVLEKYVKALFAQSGQWAEVGSYWESGFKNEIDVVAVNPLEKKVLFAEVKRNPKQYNQAKLMLKAQALSRSFSGYDQEFRGYSLDDILKE